MRVKKLANGKYRGSICPRKDIARELEKELNLLGVKPEDHLIAIMNMFPAQGFSLVPLG